MRVLQVLAQPARVLMVPVPTVLVLRAQVRWARVLQVLAR